MNTSKMITGSSTTTWKRLFAILMAGLVFSVLTMSPAHAAPPPAGTSIGNQASATYTDASGISRSVTSNVVQTIVQQVAGIAVTANGAQTSTPGTTVYYPETLTNNGNGTDTFALSAVSSGAFAMGSIQIFADNGSGQPTGAAITSTGALAANGVFKFIVVGVVPTTATSGQTNTLTVTGTSGFTSSVTASVTDVTTLTNNAVVTVTKSVSASSGAANSGPYTYTLTYTNTGNSTATSVTLNDVVPTGMTYVAASSRWSVTGTTALSDTGASSGTSPNTIASTYTSAGTTLKYVIASVAAGQSGTVTFQVNVNSSVAPGVLNNTATDSYADGGGNTVTGNSNTVPFTVTQAASVTMTGSTVASATPGSLVSFTNTVTNTGNGTDTFDITLGTNNFPSGTTFTLYKSDGVTPLTDTNGNGKLDTGPVAAGGTYNVIVKAQLPANASGGPFTLTKTATSSVDPTKSASTTDNLTAITANSVDLTNTSAYNATTPAPGQGAGTTASILTNNVNPGASTTFPIYVNNTGPVADSYALTSSTTSTFSSTALPTGWTVVFKADGGAGNCSTTGATISTTSTIAAGSNQVVCAVVTVPATGTGSYAGATELFFRGASAASGTQDYIGDTVNINPIRSITITPNNTNQTYPGGTVVYSHTLTNTGNVVEGNGSVSTVALAAANNKASWTSVLYYDANNNGQVDSTDPIIPTTGGIQSIPALAAGLAPGASITILDKVTAPSGAQIGDVNTTTITVTTTNGTYTTTVPAPAVTTDGTTVIAGNLQLVKAQALDTGCTGSTTGTTYSAGNVNALPGQCVLYQITVSNVGSAAANTVVVSDATPTYTTISTATSSAPKTTVGTITGPAAGASGTISATIGTLAPGSSAVVTFGVLIQK